MDQVPVHVDMNTKRTVNDKGAKSVAKVRRSLIANKFVFIWGGGGGEYIEHFQVHRYVYIQLTPALQHYVSLRDGYAGKFFRSFHRLLRTFVKALHVQGHNARKLTATNYMTALT